MQKKILSPQEIGLLIPHWYDINPEKIARIDKVVTRTSRFGFGPKTTVMNVPAILTDDTGYIINGRHRAYWARMHDYPIECCEIRNPAEIRFHVPRELFGELSLEELTDSLDNKHVYIAACNSHGIYTVNDLVARY